MNETDLSTVVGPLAALILIIVAIGFITRPLRRLLSTRSSDNDGDEPGGLIGGVALEVAALCSLAIGFPYGAFGYSSMILLLGFAIALAILPRITRPAIAVAMMVLAYTKLPATTAVNLGLVVAGFLMLRFGFRLGRRLLG